MQAHLAKIGFKKIKLIGWTSVSLDMNPIENLWSIIAKDVYESWNNI